MELQVYTGYFIVFLKVSLALIQLQTAAPNSDLLKMTCELFQKVVGYNFFSSFIYFLFSHKIFFPDALHVLVFNNCNILILFHFLKVQKVQSLHRIISGKALQCYPRSHEILRWRGKQKNLGFFLSFQVSKGFTATL